MNRGISIRPTPDRGEGLFVDRRFAKGEVVFQVAGFNPQPLNFINHSCSPNCYLNKIYVCAERDLQAGEEATLDYGTITFSCKSAEFDCLCGAPNCRKHVKL